jgi:hypothetical protein
MVSVLDILRTITSDPQAFLHYRIHLCGRQFNTFCVSQFKKVIVDVVTHSILGILIFSPSNNSVRMDDFVYSQTNPCRSSAAQELETVGSPT